MENGKNLKDDKNLQSKKGFIYMSRKAVENGFSTISMMILVPVFFLIALFLILFPRSEISEIENRKLATFPTFTFGSYFDGTFTAGVTEYYDDTVPYRDSFKNMSNNFKNLFGFTAGSEEVKVIGKPQKTPSKVEEVSKTEQPSDAVSKPQESQSSSTEVSKQESSQINYREQDAEYTVENGMVIVKQEGHYRAMELFGGGTGNTYAAALKLIKEDLGDSVNVYSMLAPLASEYYLPANYSDYSASQTEYFNQLAEKLGNTITSIDICNVLAKHQEEAIYCRTDHHWQPLGAYYAAQTFAQTAGVPFADLSTYEVIKNEGFVGTMYAFSGDANLLNDPETFTYYKPSNSYQTYYYDTAFNYEGTGNLLWKTDVANSYLAFMGGDEKVVKIKTDVKNGRKLCIVKDSYGNAEVPFYTGSFEEIYVIDMRYFDRNLVDFIQQRGVTDLLFTMCSYSAYGQNAENLENLRTAYKGETITDDAPNE